MDFSIGFTGTREDPSREQVRILTETLNSLYEDGCNFHHACCTGADTIASIIANTVGYICIGHPPINTVFKSSYYIANEERSPKDYIERNRDIVNETSVLIAVPKYKVATRKSGTHYTVSYAASIGKGVVVIEPNGNKRKINNVPWHV